MRPAFTPEGTVTAGNASQISDGAAAVVVVSAEVAERMHLEPLAEIVAYGMSADRYPSLHTVPALALQKALKRASLDVADLGLFEVNEAFAAVPVHTARMLGVEDELINVNGGAVALGHPIGASGARIVLTLATEMARRGVALGGAAICGGGGQGDALILRRPVAPPAARDQSSAFDRRWSSSTMAFSSCGTHVSMGSSTTTLTSRPRARAASTIADACTIGQIHGER